MGIAVVLCGCLLDTGPSLCWLTEVTLAGINNVGTPYQGQPAQAVGGYQAESTASEASLNDLFPTPPTQLIPQGTLNLGTPRRRRRKP